MKVKGAKNAVLLMNIILPINSFQKLLGVENLFPALLKMAILLCNTLMHMFFFKKLRIWYEPIFCMNFILYQEWNFYWYNLYDSPLLIGSTSNVSTSFLLNFRGVCLAAILDFGFDQIAIFFKVQQVLWSGDHRSHDCFREHRCGLRNQIPLPKLDHRKVRLNLL